MSSELVSHHARDACDTLDAIASGAISAPEELERVYGRLLAVENRIRAFTVHRSPASAPIGEGPLRGVAIAVKDLFDTGDMLTSYGSPLYAAHRPERNAALVERLAGLDATILGKTVTTEFAWRHAGPTRNPHDLGRTPGGSSSGSAAAVAAGVVPIALGTQTFGSIIRPAAFCGVVGFKPTHGVLPLEGVHPLSPTLDHAGFLARHGRDVRLIFDLVAGACSGDAPALTEPPRILMLEPEPAGPVEPAQLEAIMEAAEAFRSAGASVEPAASPRWLQAGFEAAFTILSREAFQIFHERIAEHPDRFSDDLRSLVGEGEGRTDDIYNKALSMRRMLQDRFGGFIQGYDAILTIPAPGEAPAIGQGTGDPRYCILWSLLGVPAMTIPWRRGPHGLPLGIQLVAASGLDACLIEIAAWCERWRKPPFPSAVSAERKG